MAWIWRKIEPLITRIDTIVGVSTWGPKAGLFVLSALASLWVWFQSLSTGLKIPVAIIAFFGVWYLVGRIIRLLRWIVVAIKSKIREVPVETRVHELREEPGIEFFPTRKVLRRDRSIDQLSEKAANIDAIVLTGRNMATHFPGTLASFRRVILPNPTAVAVADEGKHVADVPESFIGHLKSAAHDLAFTHHLKVRLYPHWFGQSVLLGDTDRANGWVQIESAIPQTDPDLRPTVVIYKKHHEDTVISIRDAFEKIWDSSRDPFNFDGLVHIKSNEMNKHIDLDIPVDPRQIDFNWQPEADIHGELSKNTIYFERRDHKVDAGDEIVVRYTLKIRK